MANLGKMKRSPVRMLLTGYPGAGKTGALASLVDAGYKLRILDFDGNPESLAQFADPKMLHNVDVLPLEENIGEAGGYVGVKGQPTAFAKAFKAIDNWKYEEDGETVDLGKSKEWGDDTIVVVDGLTGLGRACFRRAQALMNKTPTNTTQAVWGLAIQDQENFIEKITSVTNGFHLIVISHLKIVGPKGDAGGDSDLVKDIKEKASELVPTRLYPSALGWALPQSIGAHFPVIVNLGIGYKGKSVVRRFDVYPTASQDIKMPTSKELGELDVASGLLSIFKALGHTPPIAG